MPNMSAAEELVKAIQARTASIGICGLGYVGLPLVAAFRRNHFRVWGFDIDEAKVQALLSGESYIAHIDFDALKVAAEENLFVPTSDFGQIDQPDVILIAVPTPLTKTREPDLRAVEGTCEQIA
ncbi:MAG: NAD(P)-binding domain-containing protein, partial [Myxococcota bacterium]